MRLRNVDLVFFDTETTGLDYWDRRTWEVAAIRDNVDGTSHRYQAQIELHPDTIEHHLDPEARRITNFDERYLKDRAYPIKDIYEVADDLENFFRDAHVLGMCPDFDIANLMMLGPLIKPTWYYQLIDVDAVAAGVFLAKGFAVNLPFNTTAAAKFLGVDPDSYNKHEAMADVEFTRDYYYAVLDFATSPKNWVDFQDNNLYRDLLTVKEDKK